MLGLFVDVCWVSTNQSDLLTKALDRTWLNQHNLSYFSNSSHTLICNTFVFFFVSRKTKGDYISFSFYKGIRLEDFCSTCSKAQQFSGTCSVCIWVLQGKRESSCCSSSTNNIPFFETEASKINLILHVQFTLTALTCTPCHTHKNQAALLLVNVFTHLTTIGALSLAKRGPHLLLIGWQCGPQSALY